MVIGKARSEALYGRTNNLLWVCDNGVFYMTFLISCLCDIAKLAQVYHEMPPQEQAQATEACSQFRLMVSGSAALPETVFNEWERISGHRLLERYMPL